MEGGHLAASETAVGETSAAGDVRSPTTDPRGNSAPSGTVGRVVSNANIERPN